MKTDQTKQQRFPPLDDLESHPVFTWSKLAYTGDEFYTWQLYYGFVTGAKTLCTGLRVSRKTAIYPAARTDTAAWLRSAKTQLRRDWQYHCFNPPN